MKEETDYNNNPKWITNSAKSYSFVFYIFAAFGVMIAKLLSLNMYIAWYLGKFCNLFIYILIGYFSVKLIPKYKSFILLYLMMPLSLYQAGTLSIDSLIFSASIFLFSYSVYMSEKNKIKWYQYLIFIIFSSITILARPVYLPIVLLGLYYLLFYKNRKSKPYLYLVFISLILGIIYFVCKLPVDNNSLVNDTIVGNTGMKYVIMHPLFSLFTFIKYFIFNIDEFIFNAVGSNMGWTPNIIPIIFPTLYLIILLICAKMENQESDRKVTIMNILCYILCFGLLFAALYSIDSKANIFIGYMFILKGRYFVPFFLYFIMFISSILQTNAKKIKSNIIIPSLLVQFCYIFYFIQFVL